MALTGARGGAAAFIRTFARHCGAGGGLALTASVAATLCEGVSLLLLVPLLALVTGPGSPMTGPLGALFRPLITGDGAVRGLGVIALMAALLMLRALIIRARDQRLARLQVGFVESLRARLSRSLAGAAWPDLARLNHARLTQLLGGDLQRCGAAAQFLVQALTLSLLLTVQLGAALILSPALTAIAVLLAAITALLLWPLTRGAQALGAALTEDNMALAEQTSRFLGGLKLALAHDRQADFTELTGVASRRLAESQIAFQDQQSRSRIALSTASAGLAGAVLLTGHLILHTPAPVLLTLMAVFTRIVGPAAQLQQTVQLFSHALPAFGALVAAETALARPAPAADGSPKVAGAAAPSLAGPVELVEAAFAYAPDTPRLGPLSGRIEAGRLTGLTGPSGGGKTTLADLLTGLLALDAGEIRIEGRPLSAMDLKAWRNRLAYAPQDGVLFHETVEANLRWGADGASEADLWAVLETVGAANLVRGLPEGLQTLAGERGVRFSGGERQRLGLARALLRRPAMLILDEATSALPLEDERGVIEAIRRDRPGLTVLMISHRPETLALCDAVFRLEDGRLTALTPQMMKSGGGPTGAATSILKT